MNFINKYKRTNFYKQNIVNGILENDLVNNYWDFFKIKRPTQYLSLTKEYIQRPDLLSLVVYGDVNYWWILAKYNHIDDFWNDLEVGMTISIPEKRDIEDWYLLVLANKNKSGG